VRARARRAHHKRRFSGWVALNQRRAPVFLFLAGGHCFVGFWAALISSALAATVGLALLGWPIPTTTSPLCLVTRFCVLQGLILATSTAEQKYTHTGRWQLMLLSSVVAILVATTLWVGWPPIAAPTLGIPVGIVLTAEGTLTVVMAKNAHREIEWLSKVEDEE
jgi:uncharacterized membrane protein HdeD (DUF308 family)